MELDWGCIGVVTARNTVPRQLRCNTVLRQLRRPFHSFFRVQSGVGIGTPKFLEFA